MGNIKTTLTRDNSVSTLSPSAKVTLICKNANTSNAFMKKFIVGSLPTSKNAKVAMAMGMHDGKIFDLSEMSHVSRWMDFISNILVDFQESFATIFGDDSIGGSVVDQFGYIRGVSEIAKQLFIGKDDKSDLSWGLTYAEIMTVVVAVAENTASTKKYSLTEALAAFDTHSPSIGDRYDNLFEKILPLADIDKALLPFDTKISTALGNDPSGLYSRHELINMIRQICIYTFIESSSNKMAFTSEKAQTSEARAELLLKGWLDVIKADADYIKKVNTQIVKGKTDPQPTMLSQLINGSTLAIFDKRRTAILVSAIETAYKLGKGTKTLRKYYADQGSFTQTAILQHKDMLEAFRYMCTSLSNVTGEADSKMLLTNFMKSKAYLSSGANMLKMYTEYNMTVDMSVLTTMLDSMASVDYVRIFKEGLASKMVTMDSKPNIYVPSNLAFLGHQFKISTDFTPSIEFTKQGFIDKIDNIDQQMIVSMLGVSPSSREMTVGDISVADIYGMSLQNMLGNDSVRSFITSGVSKTILSKEYSFSNVVKDEIMSNLRRLESAVLLDVVALRSSVDLWVAMKIMSLADVLTFVISYASRSHSNYHYDTNIDKAVTRAKEMLTSCHALIRELSGDVIKLEAPTTIAAAIPEIKVGKSIDADLNFKLLIDVLASTQGYASFKDTVYSIEKMLAAVNASNKTLTTTSDPFMLSRGNFKSSYNMVINSEVKMDKTVFSSVRSIIDNQTRLAPMLDSSFRNLDGYHFMYVHPLSASGKLLDTNDSLFSATDTDLFEGIKRTSQYRAPEFVSAALKACINDVTSEAFSIDDDSSMRYAKFIQKYGSVLSRLMTLGAAPYEDVQYNMYNEIVSYPLYGSTDMDEMILGALGIPTEKKVSLEEARYIIGYISSMSKHKEFPLTTKVALSQLNDEKYAVGSLVKVKPGHAKAFQEAKAATIFVRSSDVILNLFKHMIFIGDANYTQLAIIDTDSIRVFDGFDDSIYLGMQADFEISHYMHANLDMAKNWVWELVNNFTQFLESVTVSTTINVE